MNLKGEEKPTECRRRQRLVFSADENQNAQKEKKKKGSGLNIAPKFLCTDVSESWRGSGEVWLIFCSIHPPIKPPPSSSTSHRYSSRTLETFRSCSHSNTYRWDLCYGQGKKDFFFAIRAPFSLAITGGLMCMCVWGGKGGGAVDILTQPSSAVLIWYNDAFPIFPKH